MLLSRTCEYGIRASIYLASLQEERYVSIRDISDRLDISFPFLTKIFQKLTAAGIMRSSRGPAGGIALAKPAGSVSLNDLVLAIDGAALFTECVLGLPGCGIQKPCPMHAGWVEERTRLQRLFATTSLAEVARRTDTFDLRLVAQGK